VKREGEIVVYVITDGLINEDCLSSSPVCSIVQLAVAGQSEGSDRTERLTPPPTTLINYLLRFYVLLSSLLSCILLSSILLPLYSSSTLCPCPLCSPTFHHTHYLPPLLAISLSSTLPPLLPFSSILPYPLSLYCIRSHICAVHYQHPRSRGQSPSSQSHHQVSVVQTLDLDSFYVYHTFLRDVLSLYDVLVLS
jgi:hypothetical protein